MPTPELMTWVPQQRRWTKQYRGRRHYVSARQLGCRETKEDSLLAANEWWRNRQAEIDLAVRGNRTPAPMEDLAEAALNVPAGSFADLRTMLEQALLREEEARPKGVPVEGEDEIVINPPDPGEADSIRRREVMALLERLLFGGGAIPASLPPARATQLERAVRDIRGESVEDAANAVQAHVDAWMRKQQTMVTLGEITPSRCDNVRYAIGHFAAFLGEGMPVTSIDAGRLEGYYNFCLSKLAERVEDPKSGWSVAYTRETFAIARMFVRWLWEQELIDLPRNLDSRGFRFGSPVKAITTWSVEDVRRVIAAATGPLKVAMMVMLNTGATQKDVADLGDGEVSWKTGRVVRKRSKTKRHDSVPTVDYKLWPTTFALLKKHRSGAERVLLTHTGKPYVREEMQGGKLVCADLFARYFQSLRERIGFAGQLKQLRKTGASLLESHPTYGRVVGLYLGHAPATMKEKHYAAPPQALFDEAIEWLGAELGIAREA